MAYREVEKSQTLLLNEQSRNLEQSGREVYKFGFGQSPFLPLPSAVQALKDAALRKDYSPVAGLPELREAIADFHREVDGIDIVADNVLVASGSKILLYAAMAVYEEADILIPAPSWVSYAPQAHLIGHNAIRVLTDYEGKWRVTPEAVEKAIAQKPDASRPTMMILNYPGNPDGLSYDEADLKALAEVLKKHHVVVLSDEIYGLLHHEGKHVSLARYYPEGTIVTTGLSKWCGAGGWRLGAALLPRALEGEFKDVLLGVASETYSCAPTPVQVAACKAYQWNDEVKAYLDGQRQLLAAIGNWSADKLQEAGVKVYNPHGGFYLFLDFSDIADACAAKGLHTNQDVCSAILDETGVAVLPGFAFGMADDHLTARLAFVEFDGDAALQAVLSGEVLDEAFEQKHFAKARRGIEALCGWVKVQTMSEEQVKIG